MNPGVKPGASIRRSSRQRTRWRRLVATGRSAAIGTLAAVLDAYEAKRGAALKSCPHSRKRLEEVGGRSFKRPAGGEVAGGRAEGVGNVTTFRGLVSDRVDGSLIVGRRLEVCVAVERVAECR